MSGSYKGRADYLLLGDWNAACSMCGRKRKASELVRNWQGLYRCPIHNEPRQPQDFVRNVKDIMTVPWAQPEMDTFTEFVSTFPAYAQPALVNTATGGQALQTTDSVPQDIYTTGDSPEFLEVTGGNLTTPPVQIIVPGWITPESFQWSWVSGGVGISITAPQSDITSFSGPPGSSGIAQVVIVGYPNGPTASPPPNGQAIVYVPVNIPTQFGASITTDSGEGIVTSNTGEQITTDP